MQTQYTVFFPHLAIQVALWRKAKGVNFVVNSFRCSCGSSSSSASVFAHNSISSKWIIFNSQFLSTSISYFFHIKRKHNNAGFSASFTNFFSPLSTTSNKKWISASRASRFALGYTVHCQWNRTLGVPGAALYILRNDKILAHAGIQTPDGPFTSPVNIPSTLW